MSLARSSSLSKVPFSFAAGCWRNRSLGLRGCNNLFPTTTLQAVAMSKIRTASLSTKLSAPFALQVQNYGKMKEEKTIFKPLAGIEPHIFGLLVRSVNHYTTKTNHAGNAAS